MIEFDNKGLLKPNNYISCTLTEFKQYFVDNITSKTRSEIFYNYIEYSNKLKALLGITELKQWVNGSLLQKLQILKILIL